MQQFLATIRLNDWWHSKIPPLLAVAFALLLVGLPSPEISHDLLRLALLLASICCVAAYGHAINDAFDIESDTAAGKPNRMARFSTASRFAICLAFFALGFLPFFLGLLPWGISIFLLLNYLVPTLYSVPPIRLKERGIWGIASDAAGSHIFPTLLILGAFHEYDPTRILSGAFLIWAMAFGVKGIIYHQIGDLQSDIRSGTRTLVSEGKLERWMRFLPVYNLGVELPINVVLAGLLWPACPAPALALLFYCSVEFIKTALGFQFAHSQEKETHRRSVPFANSFFYELWLPLSLCFSLAFAQPAIAWLPAVLLLFWPNIALVSRDLRDVFRAVFARLSAR